MADQTLAALRELTEAVMAEFFGNDTNLSKRLIKATNEAQLLLMVQPPNDDLANHPAPVEPSTFALQWSENRPPCEECRYDHCTAETPFGCFLITWKSWKKYDSPTVDETPWGDFWQAFATVELAKAACQREFDARLALCGLTQSAPVEPERVERLPDGKPCPTPPAEGEVGGLVADLEVAAASYFNRGFVTDARRCRRAANLLQQQAAELAILRRMAVPVPVDERPWENKPGWLDPDGECWWCPPDGPAYWSMANPAMVYGGWLLPAHAIPVPFEIRPNG